MAIKSIESRELKKLIDENANFILVDCREQPEWDEGRINKAVFMPLSNFGEESKKLTNKNAKIVLQCRSGKRSMSAAHYLESQGFTDLYNLEGGILGWEDEGFETIS
ncbi:MAG: rhodanese-like domain-containing protein [Bacteriovoracaceae bacterium]